MEIDGRNFMLHNIIFVKKDKKIKQRKLGLDMGVYIQPRLQTSYS